MLEYNKKREETVMTIYERIRATRVEKKMTQDELARRVGYVGRSAISKVEKGSRDISQSMILKYAEALDVSPTFLLYGEEETGTDADANTAEYITLFRRLSAEQQLLVIAQIKGILAEK